MPPFLTDDEVNAICDGLTQPAAMARYLARLGLRVHTKPNGRPLVSRANFETVMAGRPSGTPTSRPAADAGAVVALFRARRAAEH